MCKHLSLENAWEFYSQTVLADKTKKSQTTEIGRWLHIQDILGEINVEDITVIDGIKIRKALQNKNLSPQTIHHCLSLLSRVISKSQKSGIYSGETIYFEMPKFDNRRIRFLSKREAQKLLLYLRDTSDIWADISYFAMMTGLRAGEIFNLRISNFDRGNKILRFYDSKTTQNRVIPLNAKAMLILKKYEKISSNEHGYFFVNTSGEKWNQVSKKFYIAVDKCELNKNITDTREKIVFHSLRHTFASWLVQRGVPLQVVSSLLGHKSIKTTERYAHLAPEQGRAAVALLSKISL